MILDIGHFCLLSAMILAFYSGAVGTYAALSDKIAARNSARRALYVSSLFCLFSLFALALLFLGCDYRYLYVWQHSNCGMPWYYRISAVWGGMDGSMLLWAAMGLVFSCAATYLSQQLHSALRSWMVPIFAWANLFFLMVVSLLTNPFRLVSVGVVPPEGTGLNPLLQNPSMLIHPPLLYAGFTGLLVPFTFALAALASGRLGTDWILACRRWTLIAWGFLTAGIILGGHWAYVELGWGGFWAWDPVENASFLPWLTATAFLHSVMVQTRRGMLKVWNIALCSATYLLTIFGTFLTRSGIVQSVHAFASTDVGWVFIAYMIMLSTVVIALISYRWEELRPENHFESYVSREAAFLFNNLALIGICFAVIWGVMFPVISEAFFAEKSVVGPPYFNAVTIPLFLCLLALMVYGPLIAWRRSSLTLLRKQIGVHVVIGCAITGLCLILDSGRVYSALAFGLSTAAISSVLSELHRAARVRQEFSKDSYPQSVLAAVRQKPTRFGGFTVHLGVAVMTIAITASMAYKIEKDIVLKQGEKARIGNFDLKLLSLSQSVRETYSVLIADISVSAAGSDTVLSVLQPEHRMYHARGEPTSEVDIRTTWREDLYIALSGLSQSESAGSPSAVLKVFVNPLQMWLWVGAFIVIGGTVLCIVPGIKHSAVERSPYVLAGAGRGNS